MNRHSRRSALRTLTVGGAAAAVTPLLPADASDERLRRIAETTAGMSADDRGHLLTWLESWVNLWATSWGYASTCRDFKTGRPCWPGEQGA